MFEPSELIIQPDGSIYHLHLRPEEIAPTIITVGNPERVARVSQYFDEIEVQKTKREFVTHTGRIGKKRITVISTGIGPDNIDIVFNELDALANIDFESRTLKQDFQKLRFIRIGTTGGMRKELPVNSFVASKYAIGFDNLMHFYSRPENGAVRTLEDSFSSFFKNIAPINTQPYASIGTPKLISSLPASFRQGITLTCPGFYGPQGRNLRAKAIIKANQFDELQHFEFDGTYLTNLEMETSAIYGLAETMGHEALSLSVVLANRMEGTFSPDPIQAVRQLIETSIDFILQLDS